MYVILMKQIPNTKPHYARMVSPVYPRIVMNVIAPNDVFTTRETLVQSSTYNQTSTASAVNFTVLDQTTGASEFQSAGSR